MTTAPEAPPEGCIACETRGPLLLIGINRPAKLNGFTPRMFKELGEAYTRLDDDPQLRVGVLHAFGKTTAQTRKADLDLARHRYQELVHLRRGRAQAARNRRK